MVLADVDSVVPPLAPVLTGTDMAQPQGKYKAVQR